MIRRFIWIKFKGCVLFSLHVHSLWPHVQRVSLKLACNVDTLIVHTDITVTIHHHVWSSCMIINMINCLLLWRLIITTLYVCNKKVGVMYFIYHIIMVISNKSRFKLFCKIMDYIIIWHTGILISSFLFCLQSWIIHLQSNINRLCNKQSFEGIIEFNSFHYNSCSYF